MKAFFLLAILSLSVTSAFAEQVDDTTCSAMSESESRSTKGESEVESTQDSGSSAVSA